MQHCLLPVIVNTKISNTCQICQKVPVEQPLKDDYEWELLILLASMNTCEIKCKIFSLQEVCM